MIRSRSESLALIRQAARGAGLPMGHAEDLAVAAVGALANDPGCGAQIVAALTGPLERPVWTTQDGGLALRPTRTGWAAPMIVDAMASGCDQILAHDVDAPALLVAALGQAGRISGFGVDLTWHGPDCAVRAVPAGAFAPPAFGPVYLAPTDWAALMALAATTWVPDSAASAAAGAGSLTLDD